ncbi:MAG TPA: transcription antitermination factor NusB [Thermoanaerobaculia bacterium]
MTKRAAATARTRAVEGLRKVLGSGERAAPLAGALSRGLSAPDQDLLRELLLGVLRWKRALDAEIAGACRMPIAKLAPNLLEILEVGLYQLRHLDRVPGYAAVSEAVDHARRSGGEGAARLVNGILREILRRPPPQEPRAGDVSALARRFSHPEFLVERWSERFGPETTLRVLQADNGTPRLDLLANPRRGSLDSLGNRPESRVARDSLRERLAEEGVVTEPVPGAPLALSVRSGSLNPLRSPLHAQGLFAVQDVGSQILPLLLPPGGLLIDLAAAPGGKSLSALAHARMSRTAAVDRSLPRLRLLVQNARRLGYSEARAVAGDFAAPPLPEGRFDRVLLDAPCSGTGTLRKNPEIRYRVTEEAVERLAGAQEAALESALRLLAPGGFLLYSTCSLEWEENERVVERVVERMRERVPGVRPASVPIDSPVPASPTRAGGVRLFPDETTDGFTAHLLRRTE